MKGKGFTLIELLAVIVILAIIALIATPIVINMIGSAKDSSDERSAELYLDAVEQAVARKNLTEEFSPSTCTIQSDGNLKCDGDTLLEVQVENTKPTSGTITFEKGKIIGYNFTLGSKENVKLVSTTESCFTTQDTDGGVSITGYKCGSGASNEVLDVVIPNTINGKNVVAIGEHAFQTPVHTAHGIFEFYGMELTSVVIPEGVTSIGNDAFSGNKLTSIKIPSSVTTIGDSAFSGNKLTSVTIPTTVTTIGSSVFNNNQLPENQAFIYKRNKDGSVDKTELVSYGGKKRNNVVIPNNVKVISDFAFQGSQLTSVTIPSSVTTIKANAFSGNKLTSVTISEGVTSIGNRAFAANQLTSMTIPSSIKIIEAYAFDHNQLVNVVISEGVSNIGAYAFSNNKLTSVTIPSSLKILGDYVFTGNQLTSVVVKGKSSTSQFESYGSSVFGWNYDDSNIVFES